jgi:hypothetical protein
MADFESLVRHIEALGEGEHLDGLDDHLASPSSSPWGKDDPRLLKAVSNFSRTELKRMLKVPIARHTKNKRREAGPTPPASPASLDPLPRKYGSSSGLFQDLPTDGHNLRCIHAATVVRVSSRERDGVAGGAFQLC